MPNTIDSNYPITDDSNYVVFNPSVTSNHKLLLFLPGTGAKTKHYQLFPDLAANLGYHSVSIAYPNGFPTVAMLCANNSDTNCYYHIRQEVCYGTDVSPDVSVDTLNSIVTRLTKTLEYLIITYPSQGWDQFMNNGNLVWDKIAVSGHSQGGGHALYLAKTQSCERMIMFSGADDYSDFYSHPANWIYYSSITPIHKFFSFLHLNDDVWDYSKQYAVAQATGMTANGDDSTIVDGAVPNYSNSHCLYTAVPLLHSSIYSAEHNGPVVDYYVPLDNQNLPIYNPVWTYMLTDNVLAEITENDLQKMSVTLYPNPLQNDLYLLFDRKCNSTITLFDAQGEQVNSSSFIFQSEVKMDLSTVDTGIYFAEIKINESLISRHKVIVR